MKLAILSVAIAGASAFAPSSTIAPRTALRMSETIEETAAAETTEAAAAAVEPVATIAEQTEELVTPLNYWVPDESAPCYGLPGAVAPLGFFDPVGFSKNMELDGVKRLREAEVMHVRVAMMATVGYLIGESTPTITYGNIHIS